MMVLKLAGLFLSVAMASAGECTDPGMEEWYVRFNSIRFDSASRPPSSFLEFIRFDSIPRRVLLLPFSDVNCLLCADVTYILKSHGT